MKHLKKAVALLLALLILAAFASCGKKDEPNDGTKEADAGTEKTGLILNDAVKPYVGKELADAAEAFLTDTDKKLVAVIGGAEGEQDSEDPEEWMKAAIAIAEDFGSAVKPKIEALREANRENKEADWLMLNADLAIAIARALDIEMAALDYKYDGVVKEKDAEDAVNAAIGLVEELAECLYTEESAAAFLAALEELL